MNLPPAITSAAEAMPGQVNFVRLPNATQAKSFRAIAEFVDGKGRPMGIADLH